MNLSIAIGIIATFGVVAACLGAMSARAPSYQSREPARHYWRWIGWAAANAMFVIFGRVTPHWFILLCASAASMLTLLMVYRMKRRNRPAFTRRFTRQPDDGDNVRTRYRAVRHSGWFL